MKPGVKVASCSPEPSYYLELKLSLILLQIIYSEVTKVSVGKHELFKLRTEESV